VTIDVTDQTFNTEVAERSHTTPVVVDLWAPWCGPCTTLGPILEKVIDGTGGQVVLAKVNVDENPQVSASFQVQGIPAVFAIVEGKVVDAFQGAQPEAAVQAFVDKLVPTELDLEIRDLLAAGDEASLRKVLGIRPDHAGAVVPLAELLVGDGRGDEAIALLERIPESAETRRVAALARTGATGGPDTGGDLTAELDGLLEQVKNDDVARQRFVDLLEVLGPDDPRTAEYRKALTARLF